MVPERKTIFVACDKDGVSTYRAVIARRTENNFFRIVSEQPIGETWKFGTGMVVRCCWRYLDEGGGLFAVDLATADLPVFEIGQRVLVTRHGGWMNDFSGTVTAGPESTDTLLGPENLWWVEFDSTQEDTDGGYQYWKAQILGSYLQRV